MKLHTSNLSKDLTNHQGDASVDEWDLGFPGFIMVLELPDPDSFHNCQVYPIIYIRVVLPCLVGR